MGGWPSISLVHYSHISLYIIVQSTMAVEILHSSHSLWLTLWLDSSAVICPQLRLRHVAGRAWWTHAHTVRVVGSEERARWTVFEQRRQNQHWMPPAVSHLGHSLWEWNNVGLKRMQIIIVSLPKAGLTISFHFVITAGIPKQII